MGLNKCLKYNDVTNSCGLIWLKRVCLLLNDNHSLVVVGYHCCTLLKPVIAILIKDAAKFHIS